MATNTTSKQTNIAEIDTSTLPTDNTTDGNIGVIAGIAVCGILFLVGIVLVIRKFVMKRNVSSKDVRTLQVMNRRKGMNKRYKNTTKRMVYKEQFLMSGENGEEDQGQNHPKFSFDNVPSIHRFNVKPINDNMSQENQPKTDHHTTVNMTEQTPLEYHKAIYEYTPQQSDEMAISKGDLITITTVFKDGWAIGTNLNTLQTGCLPINCLETA